MQNRIRESKMLNTSRHGLSEFYCTNSTKLQYPGWKERASSEIKAAVPDKICPRIDFTRQGIRKSTWEFSCKTKIVEEFTAIPGIKEGDVTRAHSSSEQMAESGATKRGARYQDSPFWPPLLVLHLFWRGSSSQLTRELVLNNTTSNANL